MAQKVKEVWIYTKNNGSCGIEINSFNEIEFMKNTFKNCYSKGFGGGLRINVNLIESNSKIIIRYTKTENNNNQNYNNEDTSMNIISNDSFLEIYI